MRVGQANATTTEHRVRPDFRHPAHRVPQADPSACGRPHRTAPDRLVTVSSDAGQPQPRSIAPSEAVHRFPNYHKTWFWTPSRVTLPGRWRAMLAIFGGSAGNEAGLDHSVER